MSGVKCPLDCARVSRIRSGGSCWRASAAAIAAFSSLITVATRAGTLDRSVSAFSSRRSSSAPSAVVSLNAESSMSMTASSSVRASPLRHKASSRSHVASSPLARSFRTAA